MESLNINFSLTSSNPSQFLESSAKPASKFICYSRISCSSSARNGVKLPSRHRVIVNSRNSNEKINNGGLIDSKDDLLKWVGKGIVGFAAAVSLCCDSSSSAAAASAESLTFAFPVSHLPEVNTVQRTLLETWGLIKETFVDPTFNHQDWDLKLQQTMREVFPLRSEDAAYNKIKGMLSSLGDPFTRIISPKEYQTFRIGTDGNLQGVGLFIGVEPKRGRLVVTSCVENGPAARAGIHEGDELVEINGERVDGMETEVAAQKLRGRSGTIVTVKIHRGNDSKDSSFREVKLAREVIQFSPVSSAIIPHRAPDGHISKTGYVKLSTFSQSAAIDMENTINEMESEGVQSYILDIRNNPGGLVKAGLDVAQIWLDGNETLVNTIDRSGNLLPINIAKGHALTHNPLAILVNEGSASASEILAGALHDNGRAILIGHRTFGKGKIQSVTELNDGSALFITVAKYLSPRLHDIDQVGIAPDVQCSTEMLNGSSSTSSLEADSCIMIAEHQLDIKNSNDSTAS